ncbi:polysaccharide deacetylase family protein [Saccharothrix algeriensis]|uniref:Peptidoglycan/xylan/chitin deacetylase (PgdA/CDA1 family) n=1 Tax=Saccharothrix algeriensis TaxID=173560 RepID=A0A8T8I111_9PSEU|nr:polysaccharide deacetylase family protein [Saccharothrix algeriensis]MBM7809309.1 peptidoglycan/xylan/chitin deacetylase (PgdA/CDA1 family) [Saccharothrix algeriensis]QTR03654.1 polysaccharide deacetylase family protein [Saccharothrix algeriensis]
MRLLPTGRRARRWTRVALVVLVLLPLGAVGVSALANARTFQLYGGLTSRVETADRVVALTFDDGPDPAGTRPLLEVLAAKGVRGTFYLTGRELAAHPDLGRAIADAGHEIGNHSYAHERMVLMSPDRVADEVERTDALIRATGYAGEITFRPPNGKKLLALPRYLDRHHRRTVTWDVEPDSADAARPAGDLVRDTLDQVRPGSIVLLHGMYPGRAATREALGPIVDGLRERGYRFATVAELLALHRPR